MLRRLAGWTERDTGGSRLVRESLRHVFPDHWSFFLGEIALYCFIVLVATGIFLSVFFRASSAEVVYHGSYVPMQGVRMSDAYSSVLDLSYDVPAGLLVRQVHHWAALLFAAAVTAHLFRMFFTGAYRRPRWTNWLFGLALLLLVVVNGVIGYSVPDDLLSGTGLRIAASITQSIPFVGPQLSSLMFGGEFPTTALIGRIYPLHILLVPALIAGLLAAHLGLLWRQVHTQFPGPGRDERTVVGTRMVPAYALRTLGFLLLIAALLAFAGGFLQINPVWLYGPYRAWDSTTMAQPDWYTGWLEGGLRLFPGWDIHLGGFMLPGIFWPGVVLPAVVLGFLVAWPWLDTFLRRDRDYHNLLTMPGERPGRLALGAGIITALLVLLVGGGNDVFAVLMGAEQRTLLRILQGQLLALPVLVALLVYAFARAGSRGRG